MTNELQRALDRVAARLRSLWFWAALTGCWLAWAAVGAGLAVYLARARSAWLPIGSVLVGLSILCVASGLACHFLASRVARDRRGVARRIEARHPELATGLLAAVELASSQTGPLSFLPSVVVRDAVEHGRANDWDQAVPRWKLRAFKVAHLAAFGLLVAAVVLLAGRASSYGARRAELLAAGLNAGLVVEPGDVDLERGSPLLVVARFGGVVPAEVSLRLEREGDSAERRAMSRSLDDPAFAGRLESVASDLSYRVEYEGRTSPSYRVNVFDYPDVTRTDAHLDFPDYTALESKTVEDVRHVTAVEGTELTLSIQLNKEVATARLADDEGAAVDLEPIPARAGAYRAKLTMVEPRKLKVALVDHQGRVNKGPIELAVNVTRNKPAVVKVQRPSRDVRVSPIEELALEAETRDDFGVVRQGLSYALAGRDSADLVLEGGGAGVRRAKAARLLAFETLGVAPDELVTYHFWAEDVGPDGRPRRTLGDMFFAEVRPFEEIFRQGEQPPDGSAEEERQQGAGNARQAMQLAELQKEIINGTWAVIRRETAGTPSEKFPEDVGLLRQSQAAAIDQAAALGEEIEDQASKRNLDRAIGAMRDAQGRLSQAISSESAAALTPALSAEQAAYQALLKLRDREMNVVRGNSRQGGGGQPGGPSQRQLQQLELTEDENRYEQQRSARAQDEARSEEDRQQAELRQVMSRLRELARRQGDLNERLKELQSALEAAEDQAAREEIERQLKRLRDQEREILRDTDELRERMESDENRDRMGEAREEVEAGREHMREAAEALEENRLAQALTEGTRAGRQLDELREQLRKETSDQFSEAMTGMREEARGLSETQDALTEQLEAKDQPQRTLRDGEDEGGVRDELAEQGKKLEGLLDRMRTTVQEAEETEPQLAERLFDAARGVEQGRVAEALDAAEQLAELGVEREAAEASRHAGRGLDSLREGVERAAESVLGDETEALRLASNELDTLANEIDREIAEAGRAGEAAGRESQRTAPGEPAKREDEAPPTASGGGEPSEEAGEPTATQGDAQAKGGERGAEGDPGEEPGDGQAGQQGQRGAPGTQGGEPGEGRPGGEDGGLDRMLEGLNGGGRGGPGGPITGEGFRPWSDRMRDVEELLDEPEWQAEAARIRDRVRGAREDYRRHSKEPDPKQLQSLVADPLRQLSSRIAEEVRRRESPDALVPIDRDPVPPRFAEGVRRYYERLGSGR